MILIQQLGELVQDVHNDMTNGQSGTDDTLFDKTDTSLGTEVPATDITLANKTFTTSQITCSHVLPVGTGNTNDLTEHEINNGTTSYNRSVKAVFEKNSTIESTIVHTFDFELVV